MYKITSQFYGSILLTPAAAGCAGVPKEIFPDRTGKRRTAHLTWQKAACQDTGWKMYF